MPSSPPKPTPQLLPPPGPSVQSIEILPDGQIHPPKACTSSSPPPQLFYDALAVRVPVFIIGQNCPPDMEIDADDAISWHWIIYASKADGTDVPAATIRLVPARKHVAAEPVEGFEEPDYAGSTAWDQREPYVVVGRVATVEGCRKRGFAGGLMREVLGFAGRNAGGVVRDGELGVWKGLVLVHAQRVLEGWYGGMGFVTDGGMGTWLEGGIEHVAMWKRVEVGREGGW